MNANHSDTNLRTTLQIGKRRRIYIATSAIFASILIGSLHFGLLQLLPFDDYATVAFLAVTGLIAFSLLHLKHDIISPYSFFMFAMAVFMGGQYIAHALGSANAMLSDPGFFRISLNGPEAWRTTGFLLSGMLAIHVGYLCCAGAFNARTNNIDHLTKPNAKSFEGKLMLPAMVMLFVSALLGIYGMHEWFWQIVEGIKPSAELFEFRTLALAGYGFLFSLGLSAASRNKKLIFLSTLFLGLYCLAYLIIGGVRGYWIGYCFLLALQVHTHYRRLNIFLFIALIGVSYASAQSAILLFQTRYVQTVPVNSAAPQGLDCSKSLNCILNKDAPSLSKHVLAFNAIRNFMHNQGSSVLIIPYALRETHFPMSAYLQSIIPGYSLISSLAGRSVAPADLYFGSYVMKKSAPDLYAQGFGYGWALMGDFIVVSDGYYVPFLLLAALFGYALAYAYAKARHSALWYGMMATILVKLMSPIQSGWRLSAESSEAKAKLPLRNP
jgi:hypothetical protein